MRPKALPRPKVGQKVFDPDERSHIRQALNRYKEQHALKLIRLRDIIAKANGRGSEMISRRTLERFLADKKDTQNIFVEYCENFLLSVAPVGAEDELGAAFSKFLPLSIFGEVPMQAFKGNYIVVRRSYRHTPDVITDHQSQPLAALGRVGTVSAIRQADVSTPWSALILSPSPNGEFLHVSEVPFVSERRLSFEEMQAEHGWLGNKGVFVPCGGREYLIMVRSLLTARFYLLHRASDEPLTFRGAMFQTDGSFNTALRPPGMSSWQPAFEIEMSRGTPCAPSADT